MAGTAVPVKLTNWKGCSMQPDAMSERDRRREQVKRLFAVLSAEVSRNAPPHIGHWGPAWEVVEGPSSRLLDATEEYITERIGKDDLLLVAREVRHSWWEAAALYKQAQREAPEMRQAA